MDYAGKLEESAVGPAGCGVGGEGGAGAHGLGAGREVAVDASGLLAGVRHLDARDIEYAPILEGREGESVCAPAPTAWETLQELFTAGTK